MAGIGLFNFDIDAKSVEPIAIIALAGIAGYFLYQHLQSQQAAAAANTPSAYDQAAADTTAELEQYQQLALLQAFSGSSAGTGTNVNTGSAAATSQASTVPIIAAASASVPSTTASTSSVGSTTPGSI